YLLRQTHAGKLILTK
ncbi:hemin uptake protein HemP, partial [Pseudomonas aeruginosa]|nr:hemin uptake protein HemP [Pseudomonas aeruginosa]